MWWICRYNKRTNHNASSISEWVEYLPDCVKEGAAKDTRKTEVGIHLSICS